jgi:hypothetical protein
MIYPVKIQGFENQNIEVKQGLFTGAKLLFNGQPAPSYTRGVMLLSRDDGSKVDATWKKEFMGFDVPKLIVGGNEIQVVKHLQWYEYLWSGLLVLLLIYGGILGLVGAVFGLILNVRIFRSSKSRLLGFILTSIATILILVIVIAVKIIIGLINYMACSPY